MKMGGVGLHNPKITGKARFETSDKCCRLLTNALIQHTNIDINTHAEFVRETQAEARRSAHKGYERRETTMAHNLLARTLTQVLRAASTGS